MRRALATLLLTTVLTTAGCAMDDGGDYGHGTAAELHELLERPDAEEVLTRQDDMLAAISAALTQTVPGTQWTRDSEGDSVPCGDFGSTDGNKYTSPRFQSLNPIPADRWAEASQAVIDVAADYGFTVVHTRTENPGPDQPLFLEIVTDDDHGNRLWLGSRKHANFYVRTGCYLTAAAKQAAHDAAPTAE